MKHLFFFRIAATMLLFMALAHATLFSQVITTDPPFPTIDDQVVVTYDISQGNGGLLGVAPPFYAHAGVITNLSTGPTNWRHVVADWNVNTDKCKLTALGGNLYQLVIGPSIREFYNVPESETVLQLAFVFRNSDGSKVGRSADGTDIYANVYEGGLSLNIINPENNTFVTPGTVVAYKAQSDDASLTTFYLDNVQQASTTTSTLEGSVTIANAGLHWLKFTATDGTETVADSVWIYALGTSPVAELPIGVRLGINYLDNGTVTLVLHDPPALKQNVFVMGDFNNWIPESGFQMNRTPDGKHFWLNISGLTPGTEYAFQYLIDGTLKIADPYTNKILDPWNDSYIPPTTYPNLKPYPTGKTTGIVSVLQTNQQPYNWEIESFETPAPEDLVIYEMLVRDFVATRDIKTIRDTLSYLKRLGVNAIELMPINEFEGNDSWGYNPAFYFAPDKAYGRANDYKAFIDECHKNGIAVIIDMVLNHSYGQSPLLQMYFAPNSNGGQPSADNPWYNEVCPNTEYCWGYDFNHQSIYTQAFVDSVNHFWLSEYKVDGFRFDFTKGFTNVVNNGWDYDFSRINILKRMNNQIKAVKADAIVILEHLTANSEEKELASAGMLLWGNLNYAYGEGIMGYLSGSNFSSINYKSRGWTVPHLVGYMESHDEEREMFRALNFGNDSVSTYRIKELTTALKRMELAGAMFFTIPGPKMIWQFGELGYDVSIDDPCRLCAKPLHWEYQLDYRRAYLFKVWAELIKLKKTHEVFKTTDFTLNAAGAYKSLHLNHPDMNAMVVGNFWNRAQTQKPVFQHTGWWYDYFSGDSINVIEADMYLPLQAGEYRIYTDKRLAKPNIGTGTTEPETPENQMTLFPNPANESVMLAFVSDTYGKSVLQIFDLNGKRLVGLNGIETERGLNQIQIPLKGLKTGLYFVQLIRGNHSETQRLIIK